MKNKRIYTILIAIYHNGNDRDHIEYHEMQAYGTYRTAQGKAIWHMHTFLYAWRLYENTRLTYRIVSIRPL